jgi:hypothetical protein
MPLRAMGSFYIDLLLARLWLVVLIVAITVGTAAFYLVRADKVYEAHADMLVTPISSSNEDLLGLGCPSSPAIRRATPRRSPTDYDDAGGRDRASSPVRASLRAYFSGTSLPSQSPEHREYLGEGE